MVLFALALAAQQMNSSFRNYALCRIGFTLVLWALYKFVVNDDFLSFLFHSVDSIGLSSQRAQQASFLLCNNLNPFSIVEEGYLLPSPLSVTLHYLLSHSMPFLSLAASLRAEWLLVSAGKSATLTNTL